MLAPAQRTRTTAERAASRLVGTRVIVELGSDDEDVEAAIAALKLQGVTEAELRAASADPAP